MDYEKRESYIELKQNLIKKCIMHDNPSMARSKFNKRVQTSSESVQQFFDDLSRLGTIVHPDHPRNQLENDIRDHFVDGLED